MKAALDAARADAADKAAQLAELQVRDRIETTSEADNSSLCVNSPSWTSSAALCLVAPVLSHRGYSLHALVSPDPHLSRECPRDEPGFVLAAKVELPVAAVYRSDGPSDQSSMRTAVWVCICSAGSSEDTTSPSPTEEQDGGGGGGSIISVTASAPHPKADTAHTISQEWHRDTTVRGFISLVLGPIFC
jgi:hypothetical protein